MKDVWILLVYARDNNVLVSSKIFSSELSAQFCADIYRENSKYYKVFVNKKKVHM